MTSFANGVKTWFEKPDGDNKPSLVDKFKDIGKNIIQGFIDGVNSLWDKAMEIIKKFGKSIIEKGKEGTEEKSPSRAFKEIGAFVVEGFNIGIENAMGSSFKIMEEWTDKLTSYQPTVSFGLDTTTLDDYKPNYGEDFSSENITRNIQRDITASGRVSVSADMENGREAIRDIIEEVMEPLVVMRDGITKLTEKPSETNVYIGNKKVTDAVEEQRQANGFRFATT